MKNKLLLSLLAILLISIVPLEIRAQSISNRIRSVSWSQDNSKIAFSRNDGVIQIQNAITEQTLLSFQGDTGGTTTSVAFSLDKNSTKLASGGFDGIVKIWDSATGNLISSLTGHPTIIVSVAWNLTNPDILASVSYGGLIKVWDTSTNDLIFSGGEDGSTLDLKWSPDGSTLITASGIGMVFWDADNGDQLSSILPSPSGNEGEISSVDWGTSNLIISASSMGKIRSWDSSGSEINSFNGYDFTSLINSVRFSPDGSKIASVGFDNTIKIWNASTGQLIESIPTTFVAFSVAWSPNGNKLVYGGDNAAIVILPAPGIPTFTPTPTSVITTTPPA